MKVYELIRELQTMDQQAEVLGYDNEWCGYYDITEVRVPHDRLDAVEIA